MSLPVVASTLSRLLGEPVVSVEPITGGRNGQVYKLTCERDRRYIAKCYFQHRLDERDRLAVEFSSLQFLAGQGVEDVPRPIVADRASGCAVYEYIDGDAILSQEVTDREVDTAVEFLARLRALGNTAPSRALPPASEACFSLHAFVQSIERRLTRFSVGEDSGDSQRAALREFLRGDFIPVLQDVVAWCKATLCSGGLQLDSVLAEEERTLSPSDFGFHNALRRHDGRLVFLDFEYFGWDDPAKMIADFLLHPAMALSEGLKRRFVTQLLGRFDGHSGLRQRLAMVHPLCGLKWCLILLNEFVPQDLLRREFAQGSHHRLSQVQDEQLTKAKAMLFTVARTYEHFAYSD